MIDITFDKEEGPGGLLNGLNRVCQETCKAAEDNYQLIILSDKQAGPDR